jgi:hypothetical protein
MSCLHEHGWHVHPNDKVEPLAHCNDCGAMIPITENQMHEESHHWFTYGGVRTPPLPPCACLSLPESPPRRTLWSDLRSVWDNWGKK